MWYNTVAWYTLLYSIKNVMLSGVGDMNSYRQELFFGIPSPPLRLVRAAILAASAEELPSPPSQKSLKKKERTYTLQFCSHFPEYKQFKFKRNKRGRGRRVMSSFLSQFFSLLPFAEKCFGALVAVLPGGFIAVSSINA